MHILTLAENDFIMFQLYEASTNPLKIKSRKRSFLTLLVLSLLVICYGYLNNESFLMYYGVFCTFLVLCFGNIYLRWRHKRHYTKHVKNNFNGQSDESVQVEIMDNQIRMIDKVSDSIVKISEIRLVNEIKDYYFVKLSTGPNLIIPKSVPSLNNEVNAMIRNHNIPHIVQLDWKWR
jgi:hypothetical protein